MRTREECGDNPEASQPLAAVEVPAEAPSPVYAPPAPVGVLAPPDNVLQQGEFSFQYSNLMQNFPNESAHDALGLHLTPQTREKVIQGQYINLYRLLPLSENRERGEWGERFEYRAALGQEGGLEFKPFLNKQVRNIEEWTTAFIIYMYIYCGSHPEKMLSLLKYMANVRLGATQYGGFGWRKYDEEFRLRLSANPSKSFGIVDTELWLLYMKSDGRGDQWLGGQSSNANFRGSWQPKQKGAILYCYNFQEHSTCSYGNKCRFAHKC